MQVIDLVQELQRRIRREPAIQYIPVRFEEEYAEPELMSIDERAGKNGTRFLLLRAADEGGDTTK